MDCGSTTGNDFSKSTNEKLFQVWKCNQSMINSLKKGGETGCFRGDADDPVSVCGALSRIIWNTFVLPVSFLLFIA